MRVRCRTNSPASVPEIYARSGIGPRYDPDHPYLLTPGREYDVCAVEVRSGLTFLFVVDDLGTDYPVWYPASIFEITDAVLPAGWVIAIREGSGLAPPELVLAIPEWAANEPFYEDLVSGDPDAGRVFREWIGSRRDPIA